MIVQLLRDAVQLSGDGPGCIAVNCQTGTRLFQCTYLLLTSKSQPAKGLGPLSWVLTYLEHSWAPI